MKIQFVKILTSASILAMSAGINAYDGTNCKEPGVCWEPKPGYPAKIAGSKYDPKHDPKEVGKQNESIKAMEQRNAKRVAHFRKTGKFVYDLDDLN